jgi:hypothetical protein
MVGSAVLPQHLNLNRFQAFIKMGPKAMVRKAAAIPARTSKT